MIADKRYCLDASGTKVVDCDSEEADRLLVGKGGSIPDARARELGLLKDEGADASKAQPAPPENKARKAPPENKGA